MKKKLERTVWGGIHSMMEVKKSMLLLSLAILCIIIGSHLVSNKVSQRNKDKETKYPNTNKEETATTIPIDDETFVDTSDTIRVALHTSQFLSLYHNKVSISCNTPYQVITKKKTVKKKAKQELVISTIQEEMTIEPLEKKGRIRITSIERSQGNPEYRGKLHLYPKEGKLIVVNELSLEQYLYGVVPSEMPASYEQEALKLQAVCARTYALKEKSQKQYADVYADVVDSTASQVYNNTVEDGRCNQAVRDTQGNVLIYEGELAATYFFSTSCGYTTNATDVWYQSRTDVSPPYLMGKFQGKKQMQLNLKKEKDFRKFLKYTTLYHTFEKEEPWYRWTITCSIDQITQTLQSNYPNEMGKIGKIKEISIVERGVGGVAKRCKIIGSKGSFMIEKENAIRKALAVTGTKAIGQSGKQMTISSILPSGYFYIKQKGTSIQVHGGGFGHGVGMSQTGANRMAKLGYTWTVMAKHYFEGVSIYNGTEEK